MTFLPIVERELRRMSRLPRTYWSRWGVVFMVMLFGSQQLILNLLFPRMGNGFVIFSTVSIIIAGLAAFSGVTGADSISEEKREGTLGLLFLTDLTGWDIVLGKLVASAVPSIYAALGAMPVIALALLLGGVTAAEFWKTSVTLLNLFFLSHATAMLGSVLFRKRGNAAGVPFVVIVAYVLFVWAPAVLAQNLGHTTIAYCMNIFNPGWTVFTALNPTPGIALGSYCLSLTAVHLTGWVFIGLASMLLPYRWHDKPTKTRSWRTWWDAVRFGNSAQRAALRQELMAQNPFLWLVSRGQAGPLTIWIALGMTTFAIVGVGIAAGGWDSLTAVCIAMIAGLHLVLRMGAAAGVGVSLEAQRRNAGLELVLCCTPLSVRGILAGEWLALRRWLLWPALATLALGPILIVVAFRSPATDRGPFIWFVLTMSILLLPDMWASSWVAMWTAMSSRRKQPTATGGAVLVLMMQWLEVGVVYAIYFWTHHRPPAPWFYWLAIGLLTDYVLARLARWRLEKNFRRWAVTSYERPLGFWGYFGRFFGGVFQALKAR